MSDEFKNLGDYIAEEEKYQTNKGLNAIHYYIMQKHHWPLIEIRALSDEDIDFILSEELHKFKNKTDMWQ